MTREGMFETLFVSSTPGQLAAGAARYFLKDSLSVCSKRHWFRKWTVATPTIACMDEVGWPSCRCDSTQGYGVTPPRIAGSEAESYHSAIPYSPCPDRFGNRELFEDEEVHVDAADGKARGPVEGETVHVRQHESRRDCSTVIVVNRWGTIPQSAPRYAFRDKGPFVRGVGNVAERVETIPQKSVCRRGPPSLTAAARRKAAIDVRSFVALVTFLKAKIQ